MENRQTALTGDGKATPLARFAGLLLKGSVSLDSQSPKGSLRIQFPCHPSFAGGTMGVGQWRQVIFMEAAG